MNEIICMALMAAFCLACGLLYGIGLFIYNVWRIIGPTITEKVKAVIEDVVSYIEWRRLKRKIMKELMKEEL